MQNINKSTDIKMLQYTHLPSHPSIRRTVCMQMSYPTLIKAINQLKIKLNLDYTGFHF